MGPCLACKVIEAGGKSPRLALHNRGSSHRRCQLTGHPKIYVQRPACGRRPRPKRRFGSCPRTTGDRFCPSPIGFRLALIACFAARTVDFAWLKIDWPITYGTKVTAEMANNCVRWGRRFINIDPAVKPCVAFAGAAEYAFVNAQVSGTPWAQITTGPNPFSTADVPCGLLDMSRLRRGFVRRITPLPPAKFSRGSAVVRKCSTHPWFRGRAVCPRPSSNGDRQRAYSRRDLGPTMADGPRSRCPLRCPGGIRHPIETSVSHIITLPDAPGLRMPGAGFVPQRRGRPSPLLHSGARR